MREKRGHNFGSVISTLTKSVSGDATLARIPIPRQAHFLSGQRCNFTRDAEDGLGAGEIGIDFDVENDVAQIIGERRANGRIGGQDDNAFVLVRDVPIPFPSRPSRTTRPRESWIF